MITNPDQILYQRKYSIEDPEEAAGYLVLQLSNLVDQGQLVMDQTISVKRITYRIHDGAILYDVVRVLIHRI